MIKTKVAVDVRPTVTVNWHRQLVETDDSFYAKMYPTITVKYDTEFRTKIQKGINKGKRQIVSMFAKEIFKSTGGDTWQRNVGTYQIITRATKESYKKG